MTPILLLDGDPLESEGLQRTLKHFGYYAEVANHVEAAERWLEQEDFVLVLMELVLEQPRLTHSGYEGPLFIQKMRDKGVTTPFVVYTRFDDPRMQQWALDTGASEIISKTSTMDFLCNRLYEYLRSAGIASYPYSGVPTQQDEVLREPKYARIRIGDVILDRRWERLLIGDNAIALTWRELKVLEILALGTGRFLSKKELFAGAWRGFDKGTDAALKSTIQELRARLGLYGLRNLIKVSKSLSCALNAPVRDIFPSSY